MTKVLKRGVLQIGDVYIYQMESSRQGRTHPAEGPRGILTDLPTFLRFLLPLLVLPKAHWSMQGEEGLMWTGRERSQTFCEKWTKSWGPDLSPSCSLRHDNIPAKQKEQSLDMTKGNQSEHHLIARTHSHVHREVSSISEMATGNHSKSRAL